MNTSYARLLRVAICLALLVAGRPGREAASADAARGAEQAERRFTRGVVIRFQGPVTPMRQQYLYRSLEKARGLDADLVIIEIDSPGGYLHTSLEIADRLLDESRHTVAYVPDEALSGAAIIALACNEIIMHPTARMGDAGPIFLGKDARFRHAPEKIRSDLAVRMRDLAVAGGRPPALAEAMVNMQLQVHEVKNTQTGETTFMSDAEIETSDNPDQWQKVKLVFESRDEHFLEVNGRRAVELKLAEGNAESREQLKQRYGLGGELVVIEPAGVDVAVYILNLPLVTGLLFVIGLVALYFELSAPGIGLGGLTSGLCFSLFFWSRFLGGTAGWLEVILFLAGLVFLAMEMFVIPGFGIAGITGILLLLASLILASQDFVLPQTPRQLELFGVTLLVLIGSCVVFMGAAMLLSRYFGRIPVLNRLALEPPSYDTAAVGDDLDAKKAGAQEQRFGVGVGDWGVAESPLRPAGKAIFGDHYVDVVADGSFVEKGRQIRIVDISGNRIVVREILDA